MEVNKIGFPFLGAFNVNIVRIVRIYEKHFKSAKLPWHHNFNTFVGHDFTHGLGMVWVKVLVRVLVSE